MLFGLWKRVAAAAGWTSTEAGAHRDALTVQALKLDPLRDLIPSWGALTNRQVSELKEAMEAALGDLPLVQTEAGAESKADAVERAQLVWGITQDAAAAYGDGARAQAAIMSICADVFGRMSPAAQGRWSRLPLPDLRNLRKTIAHRRRAKIAKTDGYIDESSL